MATPNLNSSFCIVHDLSCNCFGYRNPLLGQLSLCVTGKRTSESFNAASQSMQIVLLVGDDFGGDVFLSEGLQVIEEIYYNITRAISHNHNLM